MLKHTHDWKVFSILIILSECLIRIKTSLFQKYLPAPDQIHFKPFAALPTEIR